MGITRLLPCLKSIMRGIRLDELRGRRVAVDAYIWLHKAAYGCATEICQNIPTDKCLPFFFLLTPRSLFLRNDHNINRYVDYCMRMVNMMIRLGVIPVLVFDGASLPAKSQKVAERRAYATFHILMSAAYVGRSV